MTTLPGWSVHQYQNDEVRGVEIITPDGQPQFLVTVDFGSTAPGKLGKFIDSLYREGRVPGDRPCIVIPVGGVPVECAPLKKSPYRRRSHTRTLHLAGREYRYVHHTDRRAVVVCDGERIARLHRTWQWGRFSRRRTFDDPGFTAVATSPWDPVDEAVVFLCGTVIGPPGREGAIGYFGQELGSGF